MLWIVKTPPHPHHKCLINCDNRCFAITPPFTDITWRRYWRDRYEASIKKYWFVASVNCREQWQDVFILSSLHHLFVKLSAWCFIYFKLGVGLLYDFDTLYLYVVCCLPPSLFCVKYFILFFFFAVRWKGRYYYVFNGQKVLLLLLLLLALPFYPVLTVWQLSHIVSFHLKTVQLRRFTQVLVN